jgi:hypothetical protein
VPFRFLFLGSFLAGLILAVYYMLRGVEKPRSGAKGTRPAGESTPSRIRAQITLPSVAAFATCFGAVGYAMLRLTSLGSAAIVALAGVAGLAGGYGAVAMIALWAVPAAAREVVDERYVLQGYFARVTAGIAAGSEGAISYLVDGAEVRARARSVDDSAVAAGTEVVIERIENGVAFVEPWMAVESRL